MKKIKYYLPAIFCLFLMASCSKDDSLKNGDTPQNGITLKQVDDVCTVMDDAEFMSFCYEHYDINNDGKVSMQEAAAFNTMHCAGHHRIHSMKGIEYFSQLQELWCFNNDLASLDVTKLKRLKKLNCYGNNLISLDVSKNTQLEYLVCSDNKLTSLDVSKNTQLTLLMCDENNLTSLDVSKNPQLETLECYDNSLTSLDVSKNPQLESLYCQKNNLTHLDVSNNIKLQYFSYNPQKDGNITPTGWRR